ncbi:MAG: hypothetical protein ACRDJH_01865 [Thermomicrobiales bacterium]
MRQASDPDMNKSTPWFHGSPYRLTELKAGSTITQDRALARVFSHKPTLVSIDDNGELQHNGRLPGVLHRLAEQVQTGDLVPVPGSTMAPGKEWLITRPIRVIALEETSPMPGELLSADEEADLRDRQTRGGQG